ncbi:MAG TPA: helix-turn-helix domain-containing protein [Thermoanaerobaculia bacterium]|jgi:hypothetical protein|nr:helix-turn-helix domain-containing protein [Thermoanaerobaculia bacterium]
MSLEHLAAVWEHSRQSGSGLIVLLAIASYSDQRGEWVVDQATLQKRARLGRRRVQQLLDELIAAGELAVTPGDGRGHLSTYRLTVGKGEAECTLSPGKGEADCTLSEQKGEARCALSEEKGAEKCTLSGQKGEAECTLSARKGEAECALSTPLSPPFPPDPLFPLNPPKKQETCGLRPLTGPQSATFRVNLLLEEAGISLPTPAQIGLWSKTLGGIEPLLDLLRRLIHAGLATKRQPIVYTHRVVMEQAARPATTGPRRSLSARAGREVLWSAGSDEIRWQQALEIIAETEES